MWVGDVTAWGAVGAEGDVCEVAGVGIRGCEEGRDGVL